MLTRDGRPLPQAKKKIVIIHAIYLPVASTLHTFTFHDKVLQA